MPEAGIFCHRLLGRLTAYATGHLAMRSGVVAGASGLLADSGDFVDRATGVTLSIVDVLGETVPLVGPITSAVVYTGQTLLGVRAQYRSRDIVSVLPDTYEGVDRVTRQVVFDLLHRYLQPLQCLRRVVVATEPLAAMDASTRIHQKMTALMETLADYCFSAIKKGITLWRRAADRDALPPLVYCLRLAPIFAEVSNKELLGGGQGIPSCFRTAQDFYRQVDIELPAWGAFYKNQAVDFPPLSARPYRRGWRAEVVALQSLTVHLQENQTAYGVLLARTASGHPQRWRTAEHMEGMSLEAAAAGPRQERGVVEAVERVEDATERAIELLRGRVPQRCCSGCCTLL